MTEEHMSAERDRAWAKIRLGGILAAITLVALASNYAGHADGRNDKVAACERGKVRDKANVRAWTFAERARRAAYEKDGKSIDKQAADAYLLSISDFTKLAKTNCKVAFPAPSVLPF